MSVCLVSWVRRVHLIICRLTSVQQICPRSYRKSTAAASSRSPTTIVEFLLASLASTRQTSFRFANSKYGEPVMTKGYNHYPPKNISDHYIMKNKSILLSAFAFSTFRIKMGRKSQSVHCRAIVIQVTTLESALLSLSSNWKQWLLEHHTSYIIFYLFIFI